MLKNEERMFIPAFRQQQQKSVKKTLPGNNQILRKGKSVLLLHHDVSLNSDSSCHINVVKIEEEINGFIITESFLLNTLGCLCLGSPESSSLITSHYDQQLVSPSTQDKLKLITSNITSYVCCLLKQMTPVTFITSFLLERWQSAFI